MIKPASRSWMRRGRRCQVSRTRRRSGGVYAGRIGGGDVVDRVVWSILGRRCLVPHRVPNRHRWGCGNIAWPNNVVQRPRSGTILQTVRPRKAETRSALATLRRAIKTATASGRRRPQPRGTGNALWPVLRMAARATAPSPAPASSSCGGTADGGSGVGSFKTGGRQSAPQGQPVETHPSALRGCK